MLFVVLLGVFVVGACGVRACRVVLRSSSAQALRDEAVGSAAVAVSVWRVRWDAELSAECAASGALGREFPAST